MMTLLGIDIGTTHCKVGLFSVNGRTLNSTVRKTVTSSGLNGHVYEPERMWSGIIDAIRETVGAAECGSIAAIGIASMAESGLLVDTATGKPRSPFIPWFDKRAMNEAEQIRNEITPLDCFRNRGVHHSFKYSLPKLLWLRRQDPSSLTNAVWLSAADYIAYRLTGIMATDYTLAARTYAFDLNSKGWDTDWIRHFKLDPKLFPNVMPSGTPLGNVTREILQALGFNEQSKIPVVISGHDHLCAAVTVGAVQPGDVFDSMGTAETLIGTMDEVRLGQAEFESGLSYGCHVVSGSYFWMGGIPASGGSVEWLRSRISGNEMSYNEIIRLLDEAMAGPTGILYFPYLSGSGAPNPDPQVRAAFIGLDAAHTRADLTKAVLEGTAFELQSIRRSAEQAAKLNITHISAVGGGTRNPHWMQIKADVCGCEFQVWPATEATLLGAAIIAGVGCGIYHDAAEAVAAMRWEKEPDHYVPDKQHHEQYEIKMRQYMVFQTPLRQYQQTPTCV